MKPQHIIDDFAHWIELGAADPRTGTATLPTRTIDIEAGRQHWAYRPLQVPPQLPTASIPDASSIRDAETASPIDAFIARALAESPAPAPESAKHVPQPVARKSLLAWR